MTAAEIILPDRFAALMARLGPFEPAPTIAVAVSGGPDSMALTLLAAAWAAARNGGVEAITVDHGLRPESGDEARQVGTWLADRSGVSHAVLEWRGAKPERGIQAAAREARYRLLTEHCRAKGILHLCLAHHLDDQEETHRLRAEHGSGSQGLAGMSAIRAADGVRLLRPLLGIPKATLIATLRARGQEWIEDPSNRNPAFERVRLRQSQAPDGAEATIARLRRLGLERDRLERQAAAMLSEGLLLHDGGWAEIEPVGWQASDPAAPLALGWILQSIGGTEFRIPAARCAEALAAIRAEEVADFTLGGCHLSRRAATLRIARDWGAVQDTRSVGPGSRFHWDRRFEIRIGPEWGGRGSLTVARLGERGLQWLGRAGHSVTGHEIVEPARKALPALFDAEVLLAAPQLGFGRGMEARFLPARPATSSGFTVAY